MFLRRNATVISMCQLEEEALVVADCAAAAVPRLTGDMTVAHIARAHLPKYCFPCQPQAKVERMGSSNTVLVVPDIDSHSGSSSNGMLGLDGLSPAGSGSEDDDALSAGALGVVPQRSLMDTVLLALWEDKAAEGLFRYDVTACATRVLPGMYGFVAQLNEGRATKKRPTEFRVDQVLQPFDDSKFNFNKALLAEVLFAFEPVGQQQQHHHQHHAPAVPHGGVGDGGCRFLESSSPGPDPHVVMINVSPIEYGHVLLVPRVRQCLPQAVTPDSLLLALRFAAHAASPYLRVGYNSLGAFATINHLHYQAYYLQAPYPCERAPTAPLTSDKAVLAALRRRAAACNGGRGPRVSRLADYPVAGFVVEAVGGGCGSDVDGGDGDADGLADVADLVGGACAALQASNIPFNILISDSGRRLFLWPQCYAERQATGCVPAALLDTGVNPAAFEIAGHLVLKRAEDYEAMSQEHAWALLEQVSLTEERFAHVTRLCFGDDPAAGGRAAARRPEAARPPPAGVMASAFASA